MNWWVLRRSVHSSWLITLYCLGIIIGVVLVKYITIHSETALLCLVLSAPVLIFAFFRSTIGVIPIVLVCGIILGLGRGAVELSDISNIRFYLGKTVTVFGSVKEDVDDQGSSVTFSLGNLTIDNQEVSGNLYISTKSDLKINRGDKLRLSGKIKKGFGSFVGTIYFAKILTISPPQIADPALKIRDDFAEKIRIYTKEPEASLGVGFLLGQKRALPIDLVIALQAVGLTHVVVASGYNLTILVRLARRMLQKISKYLSVLVSISLVVGFIAVTGLSPSMMRAGLVTTLSLAAWYYGRNFHPLVMLLLVMAITLLVNPAYAWGDLGWQLSFAAFFGVMVVAPLARRYFFGEVKLTFWQQILLEAVAAQIVTAPIILSAFGQISNVAVIANILTLPLIPLAMLLTFLAGLSGYLAPWAQPIFSLADSWLLSYMVSVINFFAELPWAVSVLRLNTYGLLGLYAIIVAACFYIWRKTKYNLRNVNLVE